jgi:hypothetical protein
MRTGIGRQDEIEIRADITHHVTVRSAYEQGRVDVMGPPLPHESQRDAFDAPGLEAVQEGQDTHGGASWEGRSSRI